MEYQRLTPYLQARSQDARGLTYVRETVRDSGNMREEDGEGALRGLHQDDRGRRIDALKKFAKTEEAPPEIEISIWQNIVRKYLGPRQAEIRYTRQWKTA